MIHKKLLLAFVLAMGVGVGVLEANTKSLDQMTFAELMAVELKTRADLVSATAAGNATQEARLKGYLKRISVYIWYARKVDKSDLSALKNYLQEFDGVMQKATTEFPQATHLFKKLDARKVDIELAIQKLQPTPPAPGVQSPFRRHLPIASKFMLTMSEAKLMETELMYRTDLAIFMLAGDTFQAVRLNEHLKRISIFIWYAKKVDKSDLSALQNYLQEFNDVMQTAITEYPQANFLYQALDARKAEIELDIKNLQAANQPAPTPPAPGMPNLLPESPLN
jgi:predicted nucleotide-binding protein